MKAFGLQDKIYKTPTPINHICDNVYLGDFRAADDLPLLKEKNITAIVNCAFNLPSKFKKDITYLNLKLADEKNVQIIPALENAYDFIKEDPNRQILVHCVHGSSRSGSTVIFYLMKDKKWDYETCFNYVKERRNIIKPNEGFKKQLIDYYNKNIATLIKENNNIENKNEIFEKNNNIENNINNENNIENNNNENNFENNNDK
jgi:protein-tyrosine phosphatase